MDSLVQDQDMIMSEHERESVPARKIRKKRKIVLYSLSISAVIGLAASGLLYWAGYLLIRQDAVLQSCDVAVVLQGSIAGEKARLGGAVQLLRRGVTPRILVSIPKESYWGQRVAPLAFADLQKNYGPDMVTDVEFCETEGVDSTEEEAAALMTCIKEHAWHSVAVVTSDYHTRRAGIVWRRLLTRQHSSLSLKIHAVPDPEFHAAGWWRDRRSAKTWVLEATKLIWTLCGGD